MAPQAGNGGCLQGKVFGLTGELARKELQPMLKAHGATVSAIIHKRVSFVLCTPDAVKYNTQKVRKALKHGIPLVSQGFIAACALAGDVVDSTPFRVVTTANAPASIPGASTLAGSNAKAPNDATAVSVEGSNSGSSAKEANTVGTPKGERKTATAEDGVDTAGDGSKGTRRRRRKDLAQLESSGPEVARSEQPPGDGGGDAQKKKHKKRKNRGKDADSSIVADTCPGSQRASTKGTERPKETKKRKKNHLRTDVVGQDTTTAGKGPESGELRRGDGEDIPRAQVGDAKLDKRERKKEKSDSVGGRQ
ncbi:expressed unknown protein [Ectocarpus siliculosus]|uniref:BRCT domain-containing protein n=1 Tax=Ectocarpus siliculosus TaxID=2880 RepID=D7FK01_ECTSI|nr:expressed unknown protein [Ectocarpus siliculosus]|eukprot:CBJ49090.1 expressed unknown protein [Ectocarpus siliculosus]